MPLYDYKCECGLVEEEIFSYPPPDTIECECGGTADRQLSMPARTSARWGDSHPQFIPALGGHLANSMEFERACDERGLVPLNDINKDVIDRKVRHEADLYERDAREDAEIATLQKKYEGKHGGDTEAVTQVLNPTYLRECAAEDAYYEKSF